MTALEAYSPPFTNWKSTCKIFTADNGMALDIIPRLKDEQIEKIVALLNGESISYITSRLTLVEGAILIDDTPLLLVRGWGHLTGTGGLNLHPDEAARIQDEFAEWVVLRLQGKV